MEAGRNLSSALALLQKVMELSDPGAGKAGEGSVFSMQWNHAYKGVIALIFTGAPLKTHKVWCLHAYWRKFPQCSTDICHKTII